jgi:hypothetical protein
MLELEQYTRQCEKAGTRGIKFDQYYAAVYSRLYLVEKELGKHEAAEQYYQKAAESWQKFYAKEGQPRLTDEQMRKQIEEVNQRFQVPTWKGQK